MDEERPHRRFSIEDPKPDFDIVAWARAVSPAIYIAPAPEELVALMNERMRVAEWEAKVQVATEWILAFDEARDRLGRKSHDD